MKKITIGITDCSKYANYEMWLKEEPEVEVIKLGYYENNLDDIKKCDGVLLTGGQDVHPRLYNKPEYAEHCDPKDIDEKRDEFEWKVLERVQQNNLPLLGICRGLQVANVFYGGTLIPDIPASGKPDHTKYEEGRDRYHVVKVEKGSILSGIVTVPEGEINSSHHQSADRVGEGLKVNAISADGIIEGLERKNKESFLMLVQWHPERMIDVESPFSKKVKDAFLNAAREKQYLSS